MRSPEPRVAVVVRQAGSANGLLPVLRELLSRGVSLSLLAGDAGGDPLIAAGLPVHAYREFDDARDTLAAFAPTFLLTGTSLLGDDDARFWQWATEQGIPSAAFVDSWTHLATRFRSGNRPFAVVPDTIGVPDQRCADALRDEGAPVERVRILGQPAFDESIAIARSPDRIERAKHLRATLLEQSGADVLVAFISEPTFSDPALWPGYSAREALGYLVRSLRDAGRDRSTLIAIRLHPRERDDPSTSILLGVPPDGRCEVVQGDRHDLVLAADHVVGMTSFLLREAAIMGRHVVSIQPNVRVFDDVLSGVLGVSRCSDIAAVRQALTSPAKAGGIVSSESSANKWVDLVLA